MKLFLVFLLSSISATSQNVPQATSATSNTDAARATDDKTETAALIAKSSAEYEAYQKIARQPNLKSADAQAQDFAFRFPESDLRAALFQSLMLKYQAANNAEGTIANAERVLLIDPPNVIALVTAANVFAERTIPGKPDSDERFDRAKRYAMRAIESIDSVSLPTTASAEDRARFKSTLLSIAHAAIGNIALLQKDPETAEKELQVASELAPSNALVLYRLAVAQHEQKRYGEAMGNVDKAVIAANDSHDLLLLERAKKEKAALAKAVTRP
jgi:tetratricopeptide (TPR) repeat protein